jgi:hypothetical protein
MVSLLAEEDKTTLLKNIEISIKLHNSQKLILLNHIDCGAYGGSKIFKSHEEEITFHKKELKQAKIIAQEKFPLLGIKTFLVEKDNQDKIFLAEIS